jgi:hypothetical protein
MGSGRIVCESNGEALAHNFPYESFWEYCCDCQSFWPSNLAKGGSIEDRCPICSREVVRRFVCALCKMMSQESGEGSRRKAFTITPSGLVEPTCPGCLGRADSIASNHHCDEAKADFTTPRETCPFCHESLKETVRQGEKTVAFVNQPDASQPIHLAPVPPTNSAPAIVCPTCGTVGKSTDKFCKSCGSLLQAIQSSASGASQDKTMLLPSGYELVSPAGAASASSSTGQPTVSSLSAILPTGSSASTHTPATSNSAVRPLLILALVLSLSVIVVLAILLMQSNKQPTTSESRVAVNTSTYTPQPVSSNRNSRTTSASPSPINSNIQPATPTPTPFESRPPSAGARLATCRSNSVYVRSAPYLDDTKQNVIKVIGRDEKLWALRTSTNYDTTYIRSAGGMVTDNWTEVQLYNDPSVRGWVFSYFVLY